MDLNPCIPSCWSFDGEKSSKQHEKGLDLYQSFRNYYAAWPLQRAAVCIVTNHRLQPLQGKCRNSTQGMCHYCTGERDSVSCSCPSRHKSTDTSRHQQLRSEKGNMQVVQRTKKKNTQLLQIGHLYFSPSKGSRCINTLTLFLFTPCSSESWGAYLDFLRRIKVSAQRSLSLSLSHTQTHTHSHTHIL